MNICIPVESDQGISSKVCAHFGSAPAFMIIDTDSLVCRAIANTNQHHGHGMCQPLALLSGEKIQGLVVSGIGMGALKKCQAADIKVYRSNQSTVRDTVNAYKAGTLAEVADNEACAHHGANPDHGHQHHHG
jgi:predicted Fe-Mo cluster-binding NifX family protein